MLLWESINAGTGRRYVYRTFGCCGNTFPSGFFHLMPGGLGPEGSLFILASVWRTSKHPRMWCCGLSSWCTVYLDWPILSGNMIICMCLICAHPLATGNDLVIDSGGVEKYYLDDWGALARWTNMYSHAAIGRWKQDLGMTRQAYVGDWHPGRWCQRMTGCACS